METKRSEQIQSEINRLTADEAAAIAVRDKLDAQVKDLGEQLPDLTDAERVKADQEFSEKAIQLFVQGKRVEPFAGKLEQKRAELEAAKEAEWRTMRLAEIADAERMVEKTAIVADAEWDQAMSLAGAFVPRLMRMLLEIGRLCDVNDPLRVLGGTAQNVFERSALYSNLQSVDERDVGRLSILRIPGAKSSIEETNGTALTLADFLRRTGADWVEAARRKVEMPRSDAALLAELEADFAKQGGGEHQ